jgi:hypothetical protein
MLYLTRYANAEPSTSRSHVHKPEGPIAGDHTTWPRRSCTWGPGLGSLALWGVVAQDDSLMGVQSKLAVP